MFEKLDADVAVIGENPGGIAAALRTAKAGLTTVLVSFRQQLGGAFPSLGAIETHYNGRRTPFLTYLEEQVQLHYRETYGPDSEPYQTARGNYPMVAFEPHVMERILEQAVSSQPNLTVVRGYYPEQVHTIGGSIASASFLHFDSPQRLDIHAAYFIDASSEGDFSALAGVDYKVGREGRAEYGEPHAGKLFTRFTKGKYPQEAVEGKLNVLAKWTTRGLLPGSTGEGDDAIQDYSYRLCLSCDPANRVLPAKPDRYNREAFAGIVEAPEETMYKQYALQHRFLLYSLEEMTAMDHLYHGHALPNNKRSWNQTNFTGAARQYPLADWEQRKAIEQAHRDHALGIMYFLQNDAAVPASIRQEARRWGLAKDEFTGNNHIPYQIYVREARRMAGRYIMKEHDFKLAQALQRAPIHEDSIAIAEFPLDSLASTTERSEGSLCDGQFFLKDETRPGQVPYRSLLPKQIKNLLVTETCSASHVAWGTIRQTPVLISLGEAAGAATVLARSLKAPVDEIPVSRLQRELVENGHMISFFNDFDMAVQADWVAAVQYWGARGFFASYDAHPELPLTRKLAGLWLEAVFAPVANPASPLELARLVTDVSREDSEAVSYAEFVELAHAYTGAAGRSIPLLPESTHRHRTSESTITRGMGCVYLYQAAAESIR